MRMKKLLSLFLALVMVLSLVPTTVFATAGEKVYISASHDGQFIDDKNGSPMAYVGVALDDLTAINLDTYGLSDYKYDKDGDGSYEITALHLYIYVHEVLCGGNWNSDVTVTGGAGSIYFAGGLFGFEDENLRYNYNGAYPADENGWGFTADQIVLSDGDFFEVAHFSDWYFYGDSAYGFHYFTNESDEIHISYSAETGTALPLKLIRVGGGMGMGDTTTAEAGYTVYYGSSIGNAIGSVTTDDDGVASITFSDPGTYYVWCNGGEGIDNAAGAIVSSPASATVTVTGESTGAGSGSGDGEGSEDKPAETDTDTAVVVTADSGIALSAKASFCDDCYETVYAENQVTGIDTVIDWQCSGHGTTPNTYVYSFSVNAFPEEGYSITGVTINGTKYTVNSTDDTYDAIYIDEYSYIAENYNCVSTSILSVENTAPEDITIHIHAQKDAEETPREAQDVSAVLNATMAKLASTVTAPAFGTNAGEWTVLSLARGGYFTKDNKYFTDYYDRIVETVNTTAASVNLNGALHKVKSTENSRLIVALSALGKDATAVGDWDLVEAYSANGFDWIKKQGINGTIWALIALDSHNYATTDTTIRQQCVDDIVAAQHDDGGWSLMANKTYASDPDVTGMALTALYPYRNQPEVAAAAEEAFTCLSEMQHDNGTFASGGSECSESCAWVIVATTMWGINPDTDSRFVKNNKSVVDGLLAHYLEDKAQFQHVIGGGANGMATDQSCYALVAYNRFINNKAALFDYSDVTFDAKAEVVKGEPKAILGLPQEVADNEGEEFNAVISIDQWDNTAGYKLVDFIMTVPEGLSVSDVKASSRLGGGEVSYNVDSEGKLRVVYFDAHENADVTVMGTAFPAELFTVTYCVEDVEKVTPDTELEIAITGMSLKRSSDSTDEDSMVIVKTADAAGTVKVVEGLSFSAVCLYEGDGVDLIPTDKKAVAVAVIGAEEETPIKLTYDDETNQITFCYSAEISVKSGVPTYVALVAKTIDMESFGEKKHYELVEETAADTIAFGDSNGDGVVNAQDALNAVDAWLRKTKVSSDTQILTLNVNGDSRINTFDALGIVEKFVNNSEFAVVTKAATITTQK